MVLGLSNFGAKLTGFATGYSQGLKQGLQLVVLMFQGNSPANRGVGSYQAGHNAGFKEAIQMVFSGFGNSPFNRFGSAGLGNEYPSPASLYSNGWGGYNSSELGRQRKTSGEIRNTLLNSLGQAPKTTPDRTALKKLLVQLHKDFLSSRVRSTGQGAGGLLSETAGDGQSTTLDALITYLESNNTGGSTSLENLDEKIAQFAAKYRDNPNAASKPSIDTTMVIIETSQKIS